ncbi:MAG: hypothetical protein MJ211_09795 [Bacteroidales bacterium]|nr:hypothetical protein [Bacteroidales bacterium]
MFGRENLICEYAVDFVPDEKVYSMEQANAVMDKMEARIKELEDELHCLKAWEYYEAPDTGWI